MRENLSPKSLTPQVIAMLRARPVRQPKEEQHKYQPPSPATRSLREPTEWKGLREDIDDLRRFSRLSRRLRMRSAGASHQHIGQLQKLERHAVQRRSMPEIQRADLVYLRAPEPKMSRGQACRSEEQLSSDWKPRTEFERTYFGDIHDNPRPSSSLNYHECNDQHVAKKEDKLPEQTSETRKKFDQNSNLVAVESRVKLAEDDFYDPAEIPRRIDDYVVPHSPEFRTSRERLHEIFEHNRYLRRKFFADLPAGSAEKSTDNQNRGSCKKASVKRNEEYPKSSGLGFGSTETLTSQSNHSAGSSTDGRKSRAGNTPDSDIDRAKPETLTRPSKLEPLPLTYFGSERYGGTWRSCTTSRCSVGSWNESRPHRDQGIGKSMPDLSVLSTAPSSRLAASSSSAELAGAGNESDAKYFASYVHVVDSSDGESRSASPPTATRRRGPLPPALDLSKLDRENRQDPELSVLRNYRQEPAASFEVEALIARSRERVLRSSHSLLELSSSIGNGPSSGRRETRLERMIRRRGQSAFNKSCTDLASLSQDTTGLLSPRLVGAASRERLAEEEEEEEKRRASTSPEHALAGTTLPSLYGPMPYKSPRRYVEGEVTIHYRSPVRSEAKEPLSEEELARRSAENMRRVYQEERRRKYLQELHDIDSRRHTDNFIPSQKSPIPLNRYDDFVDDLSYRSRSQEPTPEPRLVARALYNFVGQTPRELTFRRGDLIFVRRQVDKNWYEGEHNAMIGLFPFNYVEIIPYDEVRTLPKKSYEGQARAKFNFIAQTNLELSLGKGELVYLTRRVDENWYEGRVGNRKGIFPVSYVEVLCEPGNRPETPVQNKPVASPASHSLLSNGTSSGKLSMGSHHYTPTMPASINTTQPHYNSLPKGGSKSSHVAPMNETLHIDTHSEPIPYRALYNYRPQNEDELELNEGDTVYVMEKCDDGWYVGSSQRTGYFGTFPGNYVERL